MKTLLEYFSHWDQVHNDTLKTFGMFQDQELSFAPFPGAWTVGDLMLHIADTEERWLRHVVLKEVSEVPIYTVEQYPTIEAIQDRLRETHRRTVQDLEGWDERDLEYAAITDLGEELHLGWIIWHVLEHEIHHRGELSLILGMLGREGLDV